MAEESMMSGASTLEPGPEAAGAAGTGAEMITKKLANYWILIGSIPLVLFLLVAIPTVLYVKGVSEYVNAFYCTTASCKTEGNLIKAAQDSGKVPCNDFKEHVCPKIPEKDNIVLKAREYIIKKNVNPAEAAPRSEKSIASSQSALVLCSAARGVPGEVIYGKLQADVGISDFAKLPSVQGPADTLSKVCGKLVADFMTDALVRVTLFTYNDTYSTNMPTNKTTLELSAPKADPYVNQLRRHLMAAVSATDYKTLFNNYWKLSFEEREADEMAALAVAYDRIMVLYEQYITSTTMTMKDNMPKLMTPADLDAYDTPNEQGDVDWKWMDFFMPLKAIMPGITDTMTIRVAHPTYIMGLSKWVSAQANFRQGIGLMVLLDAALDIAGIFAKVGKEGAYKDSREWCFFHADRSLPYASAAALKMPVESNYKKQRGVLSKLNASINFFGEMQAKSIAFQLEFAHALSTSSTEQSRVALYRRMMNLNIVPFFPGDNSTFNVSEADEYAGNVVFGDELAEATWSLRRAQAELYWKALADPLHLKFLKFRIPSSSMQIYSSYEPSLNLLYVSMGGFIQKIFKSSLDNMMTHARYAYTVYQGLVRAMTLEGSMVTPNNLMPEAWMGYVFAKRMEKFAMCLVKDRGGNASFESLFDPANIAAVTPAFRFYRYAALKRAYPRPEYRLDSKPDVSSEQLFFYSWAQLFCHDNPHMQKL